MHLGYVEEDSYISSVQVDLGLECLTNVDGFGERAQRDSMLKLNCFRPY